MEQILKPRASAFMLTNIFRFNIRSIVVLLYLLPQIIIGIQSITFGLLLLIPIILILGFIFLVSLIWTYGMYKKEKYIISDDKIIHQFGTWFSDNEKELVFKNVTHADLTIPWIENALFGTGKVIIQAAGSSMAEIDIKSIENAENIYKDIEAKLKQNGFRLKKEQVIQKEKPHPLGVLFQTFGLFVVILAVLGIVGGVIFLEEPSETLSAIQNNMSTIIIVASIIAGLICIKLFFSFMNLLRRRYVMYEDTFTFYEGWFTKKKSFFPVENLTDTHLNQTLIDRIFGLYDVAISTPGAGKEIHFGNIKNGKEMRNNLERIISHKHSHPEMKTTAQQTHANKIVSDVHSTAAYKPVISRALMSSALRFLPGALIFGILTIVMTHEFFRYMFMAITGIFALIFVCSFLSSWISAANSRFRIEKNSMEKDFSFISKHNTSFSNDHITGVVFEQSFVDKWYNTVSVKFWSIGSGSAMKFFHIPKDEVERVVKKKLGFVDATIVKQVKPEFSFGKASSNWFILMIILACNVLFFAVMSIFFPLVFAPLLVLVILLVILVTAYNKKKYSLEYAVFSKDFVHYQSGWWFQKAFYAFHDNIKDVKTSQYPGLTCGTLRFNVAGYQGTAQYQGSQLQNEQQVQAQGSTGFGGGYGFSIPYLSDALNLHEEYDVLSEEQEAHIVPKEKKVLAQGTMSLANIAIPLSVVLVGSLFMFLPIYIVIMALYAYLTRHTSYMVYDNKTESIGTLFWTRKTTVLHSKVDHISVQKDIINKIVGNASVSIFTRGSGVVDLNLTNTSQFEELYKVIKEKYESLRA